MVKNTSEESMTNEEEITEKNDGLKNEESNDDNWNVKNPSENGESFSDPFQHQKEHIENFESVTATKGGGQVEEQTQMTTTIETMVPVSGVGDEEEFDAVDDDDDEFENGSTTATGSNYRKDGNENGFYFFSLSKQIIIMIVLQR